MNKNRKSLVIRILFSALTVLAVSGLVEIYGLYGQIYFNKGILSVVVFFLAAGGFGRSAGLVKEDRRSAVIAYAVSFVLLFTELCGIGMRLAANDYPALLTFKSIIWMAVSAGALGFLMLPFFVFLFRYSLKPAGRAAGSLRSFLATWLVVFAAYIPCLLAFYPGLYCYDMSWQWEMAVTNTYSTHHPLIHTWLSGRLFELGKEWFGSYNAGLVIYVILQLAFLSGCIAFAMGFLRKIRLPAVIRGVVLAFYMLFPFFAVLGVSTTKDVYFGGLFFLVFICVCDMARDGRLYRGWRLALFAAAVVLMGLLRNNAVYGIGFMAVCALAVFLVLRIRGKKEIFLCQMALVLLVSVAGTFGMFGLLEKSFRASKGSPAEMLSVPCQQLARTYVFHGQEMEPEDKEELFYFIPEDSLKGYNYYVSDPVKAGLDVNRLKENGDGFVKLWLRLGKQYPKEYVLATAYNTMGIWYLGGDSSSSVVYDMREFFDDTHVFEKRSLMPRLESWYRWFTDDNIQKYLPAVSLIFYTSFYSWAVVIGTAAAIRKKRFMLLMPALMLVGYMLTLLLGPCITVRYMVNIMLCVPVFLGVVYLDETFT